MPGRCYIQARTLIESSPIEDYKVLTELSSQGFAEDHSEIVDHIHRWAVWANKRKLRFHSNKTGLGRIFLFGRSDKRYPLVHIQTVSLSRLACMTLIYGPGEVIPLRRAFQSAPVCSRSRFDVTWRVG